jgi:hypothetical protein
MENFLTRAIVIVALTCVLVVGAAATAILGRDSVPAARTQLASAPVEAAPVSNKAGKKDKLAVATLALAAFEPPQAPSPSQVQLQAEAQSQIAALTEPLRQAYASTAPTDIGAPKLADPPKPKAASRPAPQKNYALLSDAQIAGSRERLKLSSAQESIGRRSRPLRAPSPARFTQSARPTRPATGIPIDPTPTRSSS